MHWIPPVDYYETWDMTSFVTIMYWYALYPVQGKRISERLASMPSLLKDLSTSYKMVFLRGTLGH